MADDITIHILREIRDELRAVRAEVRITNERLDTTNDRIDSTNDRMDAMNVALNDRMDAMNVALNDRIDTLATDVRAGFAGLLHVMAERDRVVDARFTRLEDHVGLPR